MKSSVSKLEQFLLLKNDKVGIKFCVIVWKLQRKNNERALKLGMVYQVFAMTYDDSLLFVSGC